MIDEALLVAELDAAVYRQRNRWYAVRLENGKQTDCLRDVSLILAHPAEKRYLNPTPETLSELTDCLQLWSKRHELLQWLLMGMDSICSSTTRLDALALTEPLLENPEFAKFANARLLGCPLPEVADLTTAIELSQSFTKTHAIYNQLQYTQVFIPKVRRELETLLRFDFDPGSNADDLMPVMVDEGLIAAAVNAVSGQDKAQLEKLLFRFSDNSALIALEPRLRQLLMLFIKRLAKQFSFKVTNLTWEKEQGLNVRPESFDYAQKSSAKEWAIKPSRKSLNDPIAKVIEEWQQQQKQYKFNKANKSPEQLMQDNDKRKAHILKLIKQGNRARVITAVLDMVDNHGQSDDLCKSLSHIAGRTLDLGYPELAMDFYYYAHLANRFNAFCNTGYAKSLSALNRLEEALNVYSEAKQQFPENAYCHTGYAETLRALNRFEEALKVYSEAKRQFPKNAVCHTGYAETLRDLNRLEEAVNVYSEAKRQFPKNAVCHNGYAETLRALNRLEEAVNVYSEAKQQFPEYAVCHTGYAETLRALNRLDEAVKVYSEAKRKFPENAVCHTGYAETLRDLNRLEEAVNVYSEAKRQFPKNAFCHTGYAETLRDLNRLKEAVNVYSEAKRQFPKNAVCHTGYAETLRDLNRLEEAVNVYSEAKRQFPKNAVCHTGYAETLRDLNRLEEALKVYSEAKRQFPENAVCHNGYAETLRALNRLEEALNVYSEAKQQFPEYAVCHTGYAETLRAMGNKQDALLEYNAAQLLFPNNQVLLNAKACLLITLERFQEARELLPVDTLTTAYSQRHNHVLAMSYFYEGDFETAEALLREGIDEALGNSKAVFERSLAVLLIKQHKAEEILQLWQKGSHVIRFPVEKVIYAHALAECQQLETAKTELQQLENSKDAVIKLKGYLESRYWLEHSPEEQAQLDDIIFRSELDLLLFAA